MIYHATTAPTLYPVSVDEAADQLGFDANEFDALLQGFIVTATTFVEGYLNRALINRTYTGYLDCLDSAAVDLPMPPLVSVSYVKTYDDADAATTLSASTYYVAAHVWRSAIILRQGASWPTVTRVADGVEIRWVAGYGSNPSDVPEPIRQAILICVAALEANRGDAGFTMPKAAEALLDHFRLIPVA